MNTGIAGFDPSTATPHYAQIYPMTRNRMHVALEEIASLLGRIGGSRSFAARSAAIRGVTRTVTPRGTWLQRPRILIVRATSSKFLEDHRAYQCDFPHNETREAKAVLKLAAYNVVEREDSKCPAK
ncbi:MAG: hypothetical protein ACRETZ_00220 [Steroidobacteraceae bacterium]